MTKRIAILIGLILPFSGSALSAGAPNEVHAALAGGAVVNLTEYSDDYLLVEKKYIRKRPGLNGSVTNKIIITYDRSNVVDGSGLRVNTKVTSEDENNIFFEAESNYSATARGTYLLDQYNKNYSSNAEWTDTFDPPILYRPSQAFIGQMWSDTTLISRSSDPAINPPPRVARRSGTVTSRVESVTVPAGTFSDCITIVRHLSGDAYNIGDHGYTETQWRCRGIGEVKRIRILDWNNTAQIQELELVTVH